MRFALWEQDPASEDIPTSQMDASPAWLTRTFYEYFYEYTSTSLHVMAQAGKGEATYAEELPVHDVFRMQACQAGYDLEHLKQNASVRHIGCTGWRAPHTNFRHTRSMFECSPWIRPRMYCATRPSTLR